MKVSEVARRLNVSPDTIRHYSRIELVSPDKAENGYKTYSEKDIRVLRFVVRAKALGFSLSDIKKLIDISNSGDTPCPQARAIIGENLYELGEKIRESQELFQRMERAASIWDEMPNKRPDGDTICALIEEWSK